MVEAIACPATLGAGDALARMERATAAPAATVDEALRGSMRNRPFMPAGDRPPADGAGWEPGAARPVAGSCEACSRCRSRRSDACRSGG